MPGAPKHLTVTATDLIQLDLNVACWPAEMPGSDWEQLTIPMPRSLDSVTVPREWARSANEIKCRTESGERQRH